MVAQATSCWMQTAPAFLDSLPVFGEAGEPFLAVDERTTGSGTGAGDVYVLYGNDPTPLSIVACTNSLAPPRLFRCPLTQITCPTAEWTCM